MPQVAIGRPLYELKLCDQHRLKPTALLHLLGGQPISPATGPRLGKVGKGTLGGLEAVESSEDLLARSRGEPDASAASIDEPVAVVVAEDQRIEVPRHGRVAPNHQLLLLVEAHLPPRTATLARLIGAV